MRNKHLLLVFVAMLGLAFVYPTSLSAQKDKKTSGNCPNHREIQPLMGICCLVTPCIIRFQLIETAFLTTNIRRLLSP
jgi:hypothetical protein